MIIQHLMIPKESWYLRSYYLILIRHIMTFYHNHTHIMTHNLQDNHYNILVRNIMNLLFKILMKQYLVKVIRKLY